MRHTTPSLTLIGITPLPGAPPTPRYKASGFRFVLGKPFDNTKLLAALQKCVRHASRRASADSSSAGR
jgi:FixJ family two-component response regulator